VDLKIKEYKDEDVTEEKEIIEESKNDNNK
jgi:hypothetical protein